MVIFQRFLFGVINRVFLAWELFHSYDTKDGFARSSLAKTRKRIGLETFFGKSSQGREAYIIEATSRTAFRKGNWVLIPPYNGPAVNDLVNIELGNLEEYALYNLDEDLSQQVNLASSQPDKLKEMIDDFVAVRGEDFNKIEQLELK